MREARGEKQQLNVVPKGSAADAAVAGQRIAAADGKGLAGVLAVFQTPFDADSRIDHPTLERLFDWLFANGADGVVFPMVSALLPFSSKERDQPAPLSPPPPPTHASRDHTNSP